MDEDREKRLLEIKEQITRGRYRVDPQAVADAIVRRLAELAAPGDRPDPKPSRRPAGRPGQRPSPKPGERLSLRPGETWLGRPRLSG